MINFTQRIFLAILVCLVRILRLASAWLLEKQLRSAEHRMRRAVDGIQGCRELQVYYQNKANRLRGQLARTLRH